MLSEERKKIKFALDTLDHPDPFDVQAGHCVWHLHAPCMCCVLSRHCQVNVPDDVKHAIEWTAKRSAVEAMRQREERMVALEEAAAGLRCPKDV